MRSSVVRHKYHFLRRFCANGSMTSRILTNIICLVLLSVSGFATYAGYQKLHQEISDNKGVLPTLEEGLANYSLLLNGKCFGSIRSELLAEDGYTLEFDGTLLLSMEQELLPVSMSFTGEFNALGQSGGMIFKLTTKDRVVKIGATGINPIDIDLSTSDHSRVLRAKHQIPGPILLRKLPNGSFALEYTKALPSEKTSATPFSQSLLQSLRPTVVVDASPENPRCVAEKYEAVEIGMYVRMAESLMKTLSFIGGAG